MLARKRGAGAPPETAGDPPPAPTRRQRDVHIGIDIGTSGCRAVAIDGEEKQLAQAQAPLPPPLRFEGQVTQDPSDWWQAVSATLKQLLTEIDPSRVRRIAVAGTSGTLVLCDKKGSPITPGLMYNDRRAESEAERIAAAADDQSAAHDASGSLAKLLWLQGKKSQGKATYALHQADWISNRLIGNYGHSDYHNSLKLGYDPAAERWPQWFRALDVPTTLLPHVNRPGEVIGTVTAALTESFGLPAGIEVVAGTTDSVAAFLAAGASKVGHGVTVLGSTLVLKLLSDKQIASRANGVYSHRLGR
jgi:D-ribulokinase